MLSPYVPHASQPASPTKTWLARYCSYNTVQHSTAFAITDSSSYTVFRDTRHNKIQQHHQTTQDSEKCPLSTLPSRRFRSPLAHSPAKNLYSLFWSFWERYFLAGGGGKGLWKVPFPLYCAIFARSLGRAYSITAGGCGDSLVFSLAPKAVLAKSSLSLLLTWLRISSLPLVFLLCSPRTTDGQRHLHFKSSRVLSCLATVTTYARGEWEGGTDPHRFVPCLLFFYSYAMHGRFWYAEKNSLDLRGGRGGVGWWN